MGDRTLSNTCAIFRTEHVRAPSWSCRRTLWAATHLRVPPSRPWWPACLSGKRDPCPSRSIQYTLPLINTRPATTNGYGLYVRGHGPYDDGDRMHLTSGGAAMPRLGDWIPARP
eukprot:5163842-Prymnesium_polylepis.1